jgi:hypothetical protein
MSALSLLYQLVAPPESNDNGDENSGNGGNGGNGDVDGGAAPSYAYLNTAAVVSIVRDVITPNTVWHNGRVAAAVRLQALVALHALFQRALVSPAALRCCRAALLPTLRSALDEDDVDLRLLGARLLRFVFVVTDEPFEMILVTDVHRDLIKRLDDSNDALRIVCADAFAEFVDRCMPPSGEYDALGSHYRYMMQSYLLHCSDPAADVAAAMVSTLRCIASYNAPLFVEECAKAAAKHAGNAVYAELAAFGRTLL